MAIGTALHPRTLAHCKSLNFRDWSGYYAVAAYESDHEHEYTAIRSRAGLIDVSPLFKYRVAGVGAVKLIDRVITRDASALQVGQVYYTPWCDDRGKVIDDGTIMRLGTDTYRWTSADPSLRWLTENADGLKVEIDDVSEEVAAIALQGPTSAAVLDRLGVSGIRDLKYFRVAAGRIAGVAVEISRTGYTGDLGYEVWVPAGRATDVWDALIGGGHPFGVQPAGLLALDLARLEAGLLLIDVDFHSSKKALTEAQKYSPFELGLERLVTLDKSAFNGRDALVAESRRGARRRIVGLEIDWPAVERLYDQADLPPQVAPGTSRTAVPVYRAGRQVGRATTTAWSPALKKLIALATIEAPHYSEGTLLDIEVTVEAVRHQVPARSVRTPFFNPRRKTAVPAFLN